VLDEIRRGLASDPEEYGFPGIYQQIIRFHSRLARSMDDSERQVLERRIAAYSNFVGQKEMTQIFRNLVAAASYLSM